MLGIDHRDWFILSLLLPTPTMQVSLDHKQRSHERNRCSASDSDSLIFTRSYRSALLITTPTPSLEKTSLKRKNYERSDLLQILYNQEFLEGPELHNTFSAGFSFGW